MDRRQSTARRFGCHREGRLWGQQRPSWSTPTSACFRVARGRLGF